MERPRIVVTLANPARKSNAALAEDKNERYTEAIERHGGKPMPLDERASQAERRAAFEQMDGLVISGGEDIDPARYGRAMESRTVVDPGRDVLDEEAFRAATERRVPILGICRGLQAINVFSGGRLVQHIDEHAGHPYRGRASDASRHSLRVVQESTLSKLLGGPEQLEVNSFHHQAVERDGLAPGLRASGVAQHPNGDLVEALESTNDGDWVIGVQCHPERTESTPPEFVRLWDAFISAARESVPARKRRCRPG
jgi:putative glutamine amidotransferase